MGGEACACVCACVDVVLTITSFWCCSIVHGLFFSPDLSRHFYQSTLLLVLVVSLFSISTLKYVVTGGCALLWLLCSRVAAAEMHWKFHSPTEAMSWCTFLHGNYANIIALYFATKLNLIIWIGVSATCTKKAEMWFLGKGWEIHRWKQWCNFNIEPLLNRD